MMVLTTGGGGAGGGGGGDHDPLVESELEYVPICKFVCECPGTMICLGFIYR